MSALAPTLQSFFSGYLIGQRGASDHTITAYRDTFKLLLHYIREATGIQPSKLDIADVNAEIVAGFLTHLEQDRGNSVRTRNARLAAIHSLFKHAALAHPEHADTIARVLAIPAKNTHRADVTYLHPDEVDALLAAPDRLTWTGRRDYVLMMLMIVTGLRVSEATALTGADISVTSPGPHVFCHGKGRKDRVTPIGLDTVAVLETWLEENAYPPTVPVFTARGTRRAMSTDAVAQRITLHTAAASNACPTLTGRTVTPHVLRHTAAMQLLAAGIDSTVIALWLGHESPESSRPYIHADLQLKQNALDRTSPPNTTPGRYRPPDTLLSFLESL